LRVGKEVLERGDEEELHKSEDEDERTVGERT